MDRSSSPALCWPIAAAGAPLLRVRAPARHGLEQQDAVLSRKRRYINAPGFVPDTLDPPAEKDKPNKPVEGELCKIDGNRFDALAFDARRRRLVNFHLDGGKYEGMDLSTTPRPRSCWRSLRTLFRGPDARRSDQVRPLQLEARAGHAIGKSCAFTLRGRERPPAEDDLGGYAPLRARTSRRTVTNLAKEPKKHQLSIGTYAFREEPPR